MLQAVWLGVQETGYVISRTGGYLAGVITGRESADQIGGPTPAADIAAALLEMARQMQADPSKGGIYHFAGTPDVSWADFAREIFVRSPSTT